VDSKNSDTENETESMNADHAADRYVWSKPGHKRELFEFTDSLGLKLSLDDSFQEFHSFSQIESS